MSDIYAVTFYADDRHDALTEITMSAESKPAAIMEATKRWLAGGYGDWFTVAHLITPHEGRVIFEGGRPQEGGN